MRGYLENRLSRGRLFRDYLEDRLTRWLLGFKGTAKARYQVDFSQLETGAIRCQIDIEMTAGERFFSVATGLDYYQAVERAIAKLRRRGGPRPDSPVMLAITTTL